MVTIEYETRRIRSLSLISDCLLNIKSIAGLNIAAAVFFSLLTKTTLAAGLTSFLAVGLGNSSAKIPSQAEPITSSGAGYRLIAGNQISQYLSAEAEYIDLGEFTVSRAKFSAKGLGVSGVLTIPVSEIFSVFGKAGLARIQTTATPLPGAASTVMMSDTLIGVTLGYGVQIDIAPNTSLKLTWDRYKSATLANAFTDRIDMNSAALLIFRY